MYPILRDLQAAHPEGIEGEILAVNHVVRSKPEIKAEIEPHRIVFLKVGETVYVDVVDVEREPLKGDTVLIEWTKTKEGDGMPLLKHAD